MKPGIFFAALVILAGVSACGGYERPTPYVFPTITEYEIPTWRQEPTSAPATPEPTVAVPTPTPTQTPLPLPPVEDFYQRFSAEISPLLARLATAPGAPPDYSLPPVGDRQIQFVPMDKRLFYVQELLFPELVIGDPGAPAHLFIAYSYGRSGCLGVWGLGCSTEGMDMIVRLFAESDGAIKLVEEMPGYYNGSGASGRKQISQSAIVPLSSLGEQGREVEEILEIILSFSVGADLVDTASALVLPNDQTRVAILRQGLTSLYWSDRLDSADSLAEIGPAAAEAVPELILALSDEKNRVRTAAAYALGEIGPAARQAVPTLVAMLADESLDDYDHQAVICAIGGIGPEAASAIVVLIPLLSDENAEIRADAAYALGRIGPAASESVPFLIDTMKNDSDENVQYQIIVALGRIGPEAAEAVPLLIQVVEGGGKYRDKAILALGSMGAAAAEAVPVLIPCLLDWTINHEAAETLGKIGPAAMDAVPALIDALRSQDFWYMHDEFATALTLITGQSLGEDADQWQNWWDENKP